MSESRRFTRVVYSTPVQLMASDSTWETELIDVSLKGVLVKKPAELQSQSGDTFSLSFCLADSGIDIHMQVHTAHVHDDSIGFTCDSIDIDSATHLRRLIELNVGSAELLNRNLEHLTVPAEV